MLIGGDEKRPVTIFHNPGLPPIRNCYLPMFSIIAGTFNRATVD